MVDIVKLPMEQIWSESGDNQSPDAAKIKAGWSVEVVPRQWLNWMQNRADTNIAYLLQKGVPEWDAVSEYLANKSYVQRNGVIYKCTYTASGVDPATAATNRWVRAFADFTTALDIVGKLTPVANGVPYFSSTTAATTAASTAFGRGAWNQASAATFRTYIAAQQSHNNLTALSGVTANTNVLPYFDSQTTMASITTTQYGRDLLGLADAAAARSSLGLKGAALYDVQTAVYETGVGALGSKLMRQGAYGLGSTDLADWPNGTDYNTVNITGFHQMSQGANWPGVSGQMLVMTNAQSYMTQILSPQDTTGRLFLRSSVGGQADGNPLFGNWNEAWTTGNLKKTTNQTDMTEGAVTQVGDFGWGVFGALLAPQCKNLDDTSLPSGVYSVRGSGSTTGTYPPRGSTYGILEIIRYNKDGFTQRYTNLVGVTPVSQTFFRSYNVGGSNAGWSTWQEYAMTDSPTFTGTVNVPTPATTANNTQVATTAFVNAYTDQYGIASTNAPSVDGNSAARRSGNYYYAPASSPYPDFAFVMRHSFSTNRGFEVANIPYTDRLFLRSSNGDGTWRTPVEVALKKDLDATGGAITDKANINSPEFTGVPRAPTAAANTNTTQIATTAFVNAAKRNYANAVTGLSASSTLTLSSSGIVQQWNANNITTTLPNPSSCPAGTTFSFRAVSGRTGCSLAVATGTFVEDGTTTNTLAINGGEWVELCNNSSQWFVVARGTLQAGATVAALADALVNTQLTGAPRAVTTAVADNSTRIATTGFVNNYTSQYGLGTNSSVRYADTDLASLGGSYAIAGNSANMPVASNSILTTTNWADSSAFLQTITTLGSDPRQFIRCRSAGTNYSWLEIARIKDITAALVNTALTGVPTAPTASQTTNNTQIATTAFVQAAKRNYNNVAFLSTNTTLSASASGTFYQFNAGGLTTTLPTAASVTNGGTFSFRNPSPSTTQTIVVSGGGNIISGSANATSLTLGGSEWVELVVDSTSWRVAARGFVENAAKLSDIDAALVNPSLTGTVTAPTQAQTDNSTKVATTAYVRTAIAAIDTSGTVPDRAVTADRWTTARTLSFSGDMTGSVSINGASNVNMPLALNMAKFDARYPTGSNSVFQITNGAIPNMSAASASYRENSLLISNSANNSASAVIGFVRDNSFGTWFGLDTDNSLAWGGWSHGNNKYAILSEKNFRQLIGNMGVGSIGTYAFAYNTTQTTFNNGSLTAGTNLGYAGVATSGVTANVALGGSWMCMGYCPPGCATVWVRYA